MRDDDFPLGEGVKAVPRFQSSRVVHDFGHGALFVSIAAKLFSMGALAVAALCFPQPAKADWIYRFTQTDAWYAPVNGSNGDYPPGVGDPPWELPRTLLTTGYIRLSDSIVRSPYSISITNPSVALGPMDGLVDISFETDYGGSPFGYLNPKLEDWTVLREPWELGYYGLALTGSPGKLFPTGSLYYNDTNSDAWMTLLADGQVIGGYNTDSGGVCGWNGACGFSGFFSAVHVPNGGPHAQAIPVPAPAPMALLGLGLAGLAITRRHISASAHQTAT